MTDNEKFSALSTEVRERLYIQEEADAKAGIDRHFERLRDVFKRNGIIKDNKDLKITVGLEIEFTAVGDSEAAKQRLCQILTQLLLHGELETEDRSDIFLPPRARVEGINQAFSAGVLVSPTGKRYHPEAVGNFDYIMATRRDRKGNPVISPETGRVVEDRVADTESGEPIKRVRRVKADSEPNLGTLLGTELRLQDGSPSLELVAFKQLELVSPPRSVLGTAIWASRIIQRIIDLAPSVGLVRAELRPRVHSEVLVNGLHCNIVPWINGTNALERESEQRGFTIKEGDEEVKNIKKAIEPTPVSEFALCLGKATNIFLRWGAFIFLPSLQDWQRVGQLNELIGPRYIGGARRKEYGNMPSWMLRGGGHVGSRMEDPENSAESAKGPLRMETRVIGTDALGHPNKEACKSQRAFPFRMMEAQMIILADAADIWEERQRKKAAGEKIEELTLESLLKERYEFAETDGVPDKRAAKRRFCNSDLAEKWYGDRRDVIVEEARRLDELNARNRA